MQRLGKVAFGNFLDSLYSANSEKGFSLVLSNLCQSLGFEWFAYFSQDEKISVLTTYPLEWRRHYFENNYQTVDPVISLAKARDHQFIWQSDDIPKNNLQKKFFSDAKDIGIHYGVTLPLIGGFGRTAALTFSGAKFEADHLQDQETAKYLQLCALYVHTMFEVFLNRQVSEDEVGDGLLTGRQRQCLMWLSKGKTLGEIAAILGVSLATVNYHVAEIRARLDAKTIPQAVALGIKYKEISS